MRLLRNIQDYLYFLTNQNNFKTRFVIHEVVKLGFWEAFGSEVATIFVKWRSNGCPVKKRIKVRLPNA